MLMFLWKHLQRSSERRAKDGSACLRSQSPEKSPALLTSWGLTVITLERESDGEMETSELGFQLSDHEMLLL